MSTGKTDWQKSFTVKAITREDLCTIGIPRWQAASFTDSELAQVAAQMEASYNTTLFVQHGEAAITLVLGKRTRTNIIGEPV